MRRVLAARRNQFVIRIRVMQMHVLRAWADGLARRANRPGNAPACTAPACRETGPVPAATPARRLARTEGKLLIVTRAAGAILAIQVRVCY